MTEENQNNLNEENIDDIPQVEPAMLIDERKYQGKKVKIDDVKIEEVVDPFPNGIYDPNSTKKKKVVRIYSEPIKKLDENGEFTEEVRTIEKNGQQVPFTISEDLNLKEKTNDDGAIKWVISKHPKSKLWQFMKKMGVEKLSELKGKYIILDTVPSSKEDDDRHFLKINL